MVIKLMWWPQKLWANFPLKRPTFSTKGAMFLNSSFSNNAYFGIFSSIIISVTDIYLKSCFRTVFDSFNFTIDLYMLFNPYHAKFLKWNNPTSIYRTFHYHFLGYQDENLKLVSQQYRACQTVWMSRLAWL